MKSKIYQLKNDHVLEKQEITLQSRKKRNVSFKLINAIKYYAESDYVIVDDYGKEFTPINEFIADIIEYEFNGSLKAPAKLTQSTNFRHVYDKRDYIAALQKQGCIKVAWTLNEREYNRCQRELEYWKKNHKKYSYSITIQIFYEMGLEFIKNWFRISKVLYPKGVTPKEDWNGPLYELAQIAHQKYLNKEFRSMRLAGQFIVNSYTHKKKKIKINSILTTMKELNRR